MNGLRSTQRPLLVMAALLLASTALVGGAVVSPLYTALVGLLVVVSVVLVYPAAGLYIMAAFFLAQGSPIYSSYGLLAKSVSLSDAIGVLVLAGWALQAWRRPSSTRSTREGNRLWPIVFPVALYFVWDLFSSLWSPASYTVLTDALRHDAEHAFFFVLVLLTLRTEKQVRTAAGVYAVVGSLLAVYTLATFHAVAPSANAAYRGGLPTTFNVNELSTILVVVPAFAYLAVRESSRRFTLAIMGVLLPLTVVTLIILTSREVLAAAILSVGAILLLSRGARSRLTIVPVVGVCAVAIAGLVYTNNVPVYVQGRITALQHDQLGSRIPLWKEGIREFSSQPIFGVGAQGLETGLVTTHVSSQTSVHEEYIRILANNGLVGFTLFLFMLLKLGQIAVLRARRNPASISLAVVVLISLASSTFLEAHWMWVILGLATVYGLRQPAEEEFPQTTGSPRARAVVPFSRNSAVSAQT